MCNLELQCLPYMSCRYQQNTITLWGKKAFTGPPSVNNGMSHLKALAVHFP